MGPRKAAIVFAFDSLCSCTGPGVQNSKEFAALAKAVKDCDPKAVTQSEDVMRIRDCCDALIKQLVDTRTLALVKALGMATGWLAAYVAAAEEHVPAGAGNAQAQAAQPVDVAGANPQEPVLSACLKEIHHARRELVEKLKLAGAGKFMTISMREALAAPGQCPPDMEKNSHVAGKLRDVFAKVYTDLEENLTKGTYEGEEAQIARGVMASVGKVIDATGLPRPTPHVKPSPGDGKEAEGDLPPTHSMAMREDPPAAERAQPVGHDIVAPDKPNTMQMQHLVEILRGLTQNEPNSDFQLPPIVRLSRKFDTEEPGADRFAISGDATSLAAKLRARFGEGTPVDNAAQVVASAAKRWAAEEA